MGHKSGSVVLIGIRRIGFDDLADLVPPLRPDQTQSAVPDHRTHVQHPPGRLNIHRFPFTPRRRVDGHTRGRDLDLRLAPEVLERRHPLTPDKVIIGALRGRAVHVATDNIQIADLFEGLQVIL
ncbi:hypothetical protein D3C78_1568520 [compost metagenome]